MDINLTVELVQEPAAADMQAVRDGLEHYNQQFVGSGTFDPLAVFVRDAEQTVVGGLTGGTYWGWLYVDILWLSEGLRGQGYGTRLLQMAEQDAVRRGCRHVHLDTLDFQALPFYERQGYTVWGQLDDLPPGHTRFFLRKDLPPAGQEDR